MPGTPVVEYVALCLQVAKHELLLFTGFWFILGALDDFGVDLCWIWLRLTGRARDGRITRATASAPLGGRAAVFIAAWQEAGVIGHTISHALSAWRQGDFTLYLGCYCNDPETIAAAMSAAGDDPRVRLVISERPGPTTKADCLNRIYAALCKDEQRYARRYSSVILHDAEDMVHPAELAVIDAGLAQADFVQLPVRPELQPKSPWIAGHYADEFAEAHAKAMVVRDALGAAMPAAGVGCGFSREMIARIARRRGAAGCGEGGPFAAECLTEDYELGLLVRREGGRSRFLRVRDEQGELVATRAYFPACLEASVRQKSRWIHGIAFQGWDRMGWGSGRTELWMALRDRRGPLTAIVLACAYVLLVIEALQALAAVAGIQVHVMVSPMLHGLLQICLAGFLWRAAFRFAFTTREYGVVEGLGAVMRIPVANVIAILAGQRALASYILSLRGLAVRWEKTEHEGHPALGLPAMSEQARGLAR
ncbi:MULTISPECIES: glycosyl transferase family protein [unclassified Novosphingobium]|uniref:glycosyl transferase family protein n=1 Tax=unclassified Novosphingobium TaxID=2644732 RepID=UPI001358A3F7|nr:MULTISPECIES: glycosyl transferase family protein [unclassified Novosphingobium]